MLNLVKLPDLKIIEPASYEANKQKYLTRIQSISPDVSLYETSDEMVLLEAYAYEKLYDDMAFNYRVQSILPTFATGQNLDVSNLNYYGTTRLDGEQDREFLIRSLYSLEQSNVAGSEWSYIFHAKSVSVHVKEVLPFRSNAGEVTIVWNAKVTDEFIVSLFGITVEDYSDEELETVIQANREVYLNDLQMAITERLNDSKIRPLNELQIVKRAIEIPFNVTAILKIKNPIDGDIVKSEAVANLESFSESLKMGNEIKLTKLISLLHVEGVGEVVLSEPAQNIIVDKESIGTLGDLILTVESEIDE